MSERSATSIVVIEDALLTEAMDFYAKAFTMSSGDKRDVNGVLIVPLTNGHTNIDVCAFNPDNARHRCIR